MGLENQEQPKSAADIIQQNTGSGGDNNTEGESTTNADSQDRTDALTGDTSADSAAQRILDEQRNDQERTTQKDGSDDATATSDKTVPAKGSANRGDFNIELGPPQRQLKVVDTTLTEGQPETGTEGKPENRTEGQPETGTEGKPENRTEGQPETGAEGQPETGTEGKPENRTEGQPEDKTEGGDKVEPEEATDKPAETLLEIIKDSKNIQAKVNLITHHMDNADERLRELNSGNPTDQQKDERLNEALKAFDRAAQVVKPTDIETIRRQREVLQKEIEREQEKADKDVEKLKALKIMERNLYVLERAPGFTRGNAALALYKAGKTQPEERFGGKSPAQVALIEAFKADPILRNGKDPNFWQRARELERRDNSLRIQEDAAHVMTKLKEFEMTNSGARVVPDANQEDRNPGGQTETGTEGKPETGAEGQPENRTDGQPENRTEGQPETGTEGKPETGAEGQPENRTEGQPETGTEGKPETGAEGQPENKDVIGPGVQPIRADMTGGGTETTEDVQERDKAPSVENTEHRIELPELANSPEVGGKSPLERVEAAVQQFVTSVEGGTSPKDALTPEMVQAIESAIEDSDKGITPKGEALEQNILTNQRQVDAVHNTRLRDIVWNPEAETEAEKQALPEAFKGAEDATLYQARQSLALQFDKLINEELPISDANKQVVAQHLTRLNLARSEQQYIDASKGLGEAFGQNDELKAVLQNPKFQAMVRQHIKLSKPLLPALEQLDTSVQKYKGEANQRSASRVLYGRVLTEVLKDSSLPADQRTKYLQEAQEQFTEGYAQNIDEAASNDIAMMAYRTGVKPLDLLKSGLEQHEKVEKGEADMGVSMPMLARDVETLFLLEAGRLSDSDTQITPEGRQKALANFKESGLLDRMVQDADSIKEPSGSEKFLARFGYGKVLLQAGDVNGAAEKFKSAYTNTSNVEEAQVAFDSMLNIGVKPDELFKFALEHNAQTEDGEPTTGLPLHVLARNATKVFANQAASNMEDPNQPPNAEAKQKALETMKPLLDKMVEEADLDRDKTGDDKYIARRVYGEILLHAGDKEGAQAQLKEAYKSTDNPEEAQLTLGAAIRAGAKPSDLLKYALEVNQEVNDGAEPMGLPMHLLVRNAGELYQLEVASNMDDPTKEPTLEAKQKAVETLKPLFEQMITQSDGAPVATGDESYMARRIYGEVLADAQDPKAKEVLTEAFTRVPNLDEAILASQSAIRAGATNHELLKAIVEHSESTAGTTDSKPRLSSNELLEATTLLIQDEIQRSELKIDGTEVEPQEFWKHINEKYGPEMAKLDELFAKELEDVKSVNESLASEFESLKPKGEAELARFNELHEKLFNPNPDSANASAARANSINNMVALLAGGEQEQQGRAFFEQNDPQWLKDFDEWSKLVSPDGDSEAVKKMVIIEQNRPVEEAKLKEALTTNLSFENLQTKLLEFSGDRDKARLNFLEALVDVPQKYRQELVEENQELAQMKEVLTGERAHLALSQMSTPQLQEHVKRLSMRPAEITFVDGTGKEKTIVISEDQDVSTLRIDGQPIDLSDTSKYKVTWGQFDQKIAGENIEAYKEAYTELLKRSDNPVDLQGNELSFEQLRELVEQRTKSLDHGVDYTQEGTKTTAPDGTEVIEYPKLTDTRRMELHMEVVSALKTLSDPVTTRMEYAMRMESLGQREDASKAYQEAFEHLREIPQQLIDKQRALLNVDEAKLVGVTVSPFGGQQVLATNGITELKAIINGNDQVGTAVIDEMSKGLDGKTYMMDARKYGLTDLGALYGIENLNTVLAKRAALFYLSPQFEQTQKNGGVLQYLNDKGEPVPEELIPEGMAKIPHGKWTFGNTDSFKPEAARRAMAVAVSRAEGISLEEATKKVNFDQEQVVRMMEYLRDADALKNNLPHTMQDTEMASLYSATLANVDANLVQALRDDVGDNLWADAAGVTAAGLTFALLTRSKWLAPKTGQTLTRSYLKAGVALTLATGITGGARYGTMYALTGDGGTFEDHLLGTFGAVGTAYLGTKVISKLGPGETFRMLPEEHALKMSDMLRRFPGGTRAANFADEIKHTLNLSETMANVSNNMSRIASKLSGRAEQGTIGQVMSGLPAHTREHFKKFVALSADDLALPLKHPSAQAMLREAGISSRRLLGRETYGLSKEALEELGENATVRDLQNALRKAGKFDPKQFRKLVDLEPDDLLRPLTDDMAREIFERGRFYGAGYRGVAKELMEQLEKGKLTDIARLTDELRPNLAPFVEARQVVDDIAKNIKAPYGKAPTLGDFRKYLMSLGSEGRALARQIPDNADLLARNLASDSGEMVVRQLGLHGQRLGQIAAIAQGEVVERTANSFSRALGGEASTTSAANLRQALSSLGEDGLVKQLDDAVARLSRQGVDLGDLSKINLGDDAGQAILREARLHHVPGVLNDPARAVTQIAESMGKAADDLSLDQVHKALKEGGFAKEARSLNAAAKEAGVDLSTTKLVDAEDIIANAKLHHNPSMLSSTAETVAMQTAELTDDLIKSFGPGYSAPTNAGLNHFKEMYRNMIPEGASMSDEAFQKVFDDAFPNFKGIPLETPLSEVMKYNLKAFDGPGLKLLLAQMDPAAAAAIQGIKPGVTGTAGHVLRSSGRTTSGAMRTAWDAGRQAAADPVGTVVNPVVNAGRAALDPVKRAEFFASIKPALNTARVRTGEGLMYGLNKTGEGTMWTLGKGRDLAKAGWDRIRPHRLGEVSSWGDVFNAGTANAVHGYAGMKLIQSSTSGVRVWRGRINPETDKPYTYTEAWAKATLPDLENSSVAGTTLGTAFDLWFISSVLRTGGLRNPVRGQHGVMSTGLQNPSAIQALRSGLWRGGTSPFRAAYRGYGNLKHFAMRDGVAAETLRAATTGGALLTADWVFQTGATGLQNATDRGLSTLLDSSTYRSEVGPNAYEKLENLRTPVANDPYFRRPSWEQLYEQAKEAEAAKAQSGHGQETRETTVKAEAAPSNEEVRQAPAQEEKRDGTANPADQGQPRVVPKEAGDDDQFRSTNHGAF